MRQVDQPENMPALGAPIRAPLPKPVPVASKDGRFVTGIDGKLSTTIPLPPTGFKQYHCTHEMLPSPSEWEWYKYPG